MSKIYCLFSIANNYDQPKNNLVCAWVGKPDFKTFCSAFEIPDLSKEDIYDAATRYGEALQLINKIYSSDYEQRIFGQDYRFEVIESGQILKQ